MKPASYITTYRSAGGYKALLVWWNDEEPDLGGFWEPYQTGIGAYATQREAEAEAIDWAAAEGIEFKPSQEKS